MINPIEKSKKLENCVFKDGKRYFGIFMIEKDVNSSSLTINAYSTGCNINCFYCASLMRDFENGYVPDVNLKMNKNCGLEAGYYSPKELFEAYIKLAEYAVKHSDMYGKLPVESFAILDCETTVGIEYIYELLALIQRYNRENNTNYVFSLFTNGITLGYYPELIERLAKYKDCAFVRISIKGGNKKDFAGRTFLEEKFFEYPFIAIGNCIQAGIGVSVAVLNDKYIMSESEYEEILQLLRKYNYNDAVYEETFVMARGCKGRMEIHKQNNPDYEFRFKFRKNMKLIYFDDSELDIVNKLKSGIRRAISETVSVNKCSLDLNCDENCETVVFVGAYDKYKSFFDKYLEKTKMKSLEYIFLNTSDIWVEEMKMCDGSQILIKNYCSLFDSKEDMNVAKSRVTAGNRLTYFWTKDIA